MDVRQTPFRKKARAITMSVVLPEIYRLIARYVCAEKNRLHGSNRYFPGLAIARYSHQASVGISHPDLLLSVAIEAKPKVQ